MSMSLARRRGGPLSPGRPFDTGAFIRKYDALGNQLWTKQFGSSQVSVVPIGLAVDNRFVYVVSQVRGSNFHFLKFRVDGSSVSSASMSMTDARPGAFTIDDAGNFYILAEWGFSVKLFKYTLVPFKYGERPRLLWSKTVSGAWMPYLGDVITDGNGNVYMSYSFNSPDGNKATPFLTKFNTNGDILFTRDLSPNNATVQYTDARRLSASTEAIYVSGTTSVAYPGYTNKGSDDVFVLKYSSSGTRLWARQFGTNSHDGAYGLAVSGRVFVAGYTNGRPNLLGQGTPGTYNDDAFVRSLNVNTGSVIWTEQ